MLAGQKHWLWVLYLENSLQQGVLTCKRYQVRHYHATVDIFKSKPSKPSEQLVDAATLLAHVTPCYPRELASFPMQLLQLLEAHHLLMHGSVRKVFAAVRLWSAQPVERRTNAPDPRTRGRSWRIA